MQSKSYVFKNCMPQGPAVNTRFPLQNLNIYLTAINRYGYAVIGMYDSHLSLGNATHQINSYAQIAN